MWFGKLKGNGVIWSSKKTDLFSYESWVLCIYWGVGWEEDQLIYLSVQEQ